MDNNSHKTCRRRVYRTAAIRQEFVTRFRQSGLSAVDFCAKHEINLQTFYSWLAKERKNSTPLSMQEVRVSLPSSGPEIRVSFPNRVEVYVRVDSPSALATVFREAAQC